MAQTFFGFHIAPCYGPSGYMPNGEGWKTGLLTSRCSDAPRVMVRSVCSAAICSLKPRGEKIGHLSKTIVLGDEKICWISQGRLRGSISHLVCVD